LAASSEQTSRAVSATGRAAQDAPQERAGLPNLISPANRGQGPGRCREGVRGGAGRGQGRGRPVESGEPAGEGGGSWPELGPLRGRRLAPAGRAPRRVADRITGEAARWPGLLWVPVRHDRALRRGCHGMGRGGRASGARGFLSPGPPGCARGLVPAAGTPARSPAGARTGSGAGGRGTRPGDEAWPPRPSTPSCWPPRARSRRLRHPAWKGSARGNGSWSPWSPGVTPTRRSPASCLSACARSAPTWTGSGTRPDAGAALTSPALPSAPAWS